MSEQLNNPERPKVELEGKPEEMSWIEWRKQERERRLGFKHKKQPKDEEKDDDGSVPQAPIRSGCCESCCERFRCCHRCYGIQNCFKCSCCWFFVILLLIITLLAIIATIAVKLYFHLRP